MENNAVKNNVFTDLKQWIANVGMSRIIIFGFFFFLLFLTPSQEIPLSISNVLIRVGLNGVLVLSMVPSIKAGLGPNFAIPFGIIAGLLGGLISIEMNLFGGAGFWVAVLFAVIIAIPFGILYGILLNQVKGSEMMISTYFGYAVVAIMCIGWLILPFKNPATKWLMGVGLRNTVTLEKFFGKYLSDMLGVNIAYEAGSVSDSPMVLIVVVAIALAVVWYLFIRNKTVDTDLMTDAQIASIRASNKTNTRKGIIAMAGVVVVAMIIWLLKADSGVWATIRGIFIKPVLFKTPTQLIIPTGMLIFTGGCLVLMWLYMQSKTGIAMSAVGDNPNYASASGIKVNKMRIVGATLSIILAAIGILVYAQGYGFLQLYNAPMNMTFPPIAAILIGGASTKNAKISNVVIGVILFQGILTLGPPIAARYLSEIGGGNDPTEIVRIIITNGIILYALTKAGGGNNGK